jgi:cytochrome c551/c552
MKRMYTMATRMLAMANTGASDAINRHKACGGGHNRRSQSLVRSYSGVPERQLWESKARHLEVSGIKHCPPVR